MNNPFPQIIKYLKDLSEIAFTIIKVLFPNSILMDLVQQLLEVA